MFIDTNVLVAVRFATAPHHAAARASVDRAAGSVEPLRISRQVLREYLATVTRPQIWSRPLSMAEALEDIRRLISSFEILEDRPQLTEVLTALCREAQVAGRQVHDANIAATMLADSERRLLTFNARDFRRYGDLLEMVDVETVR